MGKLNIDIDRKIAERADEFAEREYECGADERAHLSKGYYWGYKDAQKDLALSFEFSFDVPDNDGHIVFTPMDNMTIRKELKLKKGERVIVSIRKEHEKE